MVVVVVLSVMLLLVVVVRERGRMIAVYLELEPNCFNFPIKSVKLLVYAVDFHLLRLHHITKLGSKRLVESWEYLGSILGVLGLGTILLLAR